MTLTAQALIAAHDRSFRNKPNIEQSSTCGCFHCLKTCKPSDIREFVRRDETAICPFCGIDALMGDASGFPVIDRAFLQEMRDFWFAKTP